LLIPRKARKGGKIHFEMPERGKKKKTKTVKPTGSRERIQREAAPGFLRREGH